jgi:sulfur carrier protein ThiS
VTGSIRVSTKGLFDERLRQDLVVSAGHTVAEVIAGLRIKDSTAVAALVNGRLPDPTYELLSGDEVVLIELISGGQ